MAVTESNFQTNCNPGTLTFSGLLMLPLPQRLTDAFHGRRISASLVELSSVTSLLEKNGSKAVALHFLHHGEHEHFFSLTYPKRRFEWFGGRLAAKAAADWYCGHNLPPCMTANAWHRWLVGNAPSGRPYVRFCGAGQSPVLPHISISHSGGWAAALAADVPCGLDIQKQTPTILRVAERFASSNERQILASIPALVSRDEITRLTLLWAAKEACRKAADTSPLPEFLKLELQESRIDTTGSGFFLGLRHVGVGGMFFVYAWEWGNCGVAMVV